MTNAVKALRTRLVLVLMLAFALTLIAACGGSDADDGDAVAAGGEAQQDDGDAHADDAGELEGGALAVWADLVIEWKWADFSYQPARLTIKAGEVVHFNIENTVNNRHDVTIERIDADMYVVLLPGGGDHEGMEGMEADLDFSMAPEARGAVQIRVNEPGEYVFYCTIPGHREAGMEGILVVEPADS